MTAAVLEQDRSRRAAWADRAEDEPQHEHCGRGEPLRPDERPANERRSERFGILRRNNETAVRALDEPAGLLQPPKQRQAGPPP